MLTSNSRNRAVPVLPLRGAAAAALRCDTGAISGQDRLMSAAIRWVTHYLAGKASIDWHKHIQQDHCRTNSLWQRRFYLRYGALTGTSRVFLHQPLHLILVARLGASCSS
jgi:hypothetical protein